MFNCIQQAAKHGSKVAVSRNGIEHTYADLLAASAEWAGRLLNGEKDLSERRVAFMVAPGADYVIVQWAIWRAGGIAVPLCLDYPFPSLQYVLEDTGADTIIADEVYAGMFSAYAAEKGIRLFTTTQTAQSTAALLPEVSDTRGALILYTSGTTSLPKGVVLTHTNLESQVTTLIKAWEWTASDSTICVLPLHHVHGIVNVVCCSLYAGARCEFIQGFSSEKVFSLFREKKINVFMAVPTVYFKLITYFEAATAAEQAAITQLLTPFRLMVCGSAALPVSVLEKWRNISTHTLLERYGMTEIGMAISNPYLGERKAGYVGIPLPGVAVRLSDENGNDVAADQPGEILVKSASVFREYWNKPEATQKSFTEDGWFRTGDVAVQENGYYRIMGRNSVDIIKSGGYKISALEIEEVLRTHVAVSDCAVVGLPDEEWGERVAAVLVLRNEDADLKEIENWLRTQMAAYKTPRRYLAVKELPRNAMGKVVKNEVKQLFS
jgi:malonyl-CoA/methylmalonyl-CoA synthetase